MNITIWILGSIIFGAIGYWLIKEFLIILKRRASLQILLGGVDQILRTSNESSPLSLTTVMQQLERILHRLNVIEDRIDQLDSKLEQLAWVDIDKSQQLVRTNNDEDEQEGLLVTNNNSEDPPKQKLIKLLKEFEDELFEKEDQFHYSGWKQKLEQRLQDYPNIAIHLTSKSKNIVELRLNLGRLRNYIETFSGTFSDYNISDFTEDITKVDNSVNSIFENILSGDDKEITSDKILSSINDLLGENGLNIKLPKGLLPEFSMPKETFEKRLANGLANPGSSIKFLAITESVNQALYNNQPILPILTKAEYFYTLKEIIILREEDSESHRKFLTWFEPPILDFDSAATQNLILELEHQTTKGKTVGPSINLFLLFYFVGTREIKFVYDLSKDIFGESVYDSLKTLIDVWAETDLIKHE